MDSSELPACHSNHILKENGSDTLKITIPENKQKAFEFSDLLEAVNHKYGYDFRQYSETHIRRRILNRMTLSGIADINELQIKVLNDELFASVFLQDLSITVTEMFRDPVFYKSLREKVIPVLKTYPFLKIWHAGCSTGEEAYSMAILLLEEGLFERTTIYATDFNQQVLNRAKEGIFSTKMMKEYDLNYKLSGGKASMSNYYTSDDNNVIMNQSLKKKIVWANHNLVTDSVFAEVNLILCRNVLIYFDRNLQNKVQSLFHNSLIDGGILCLGTKESLRFTDFNDKYSVLDEKQRIFKRSINKRYEAIVIGVSSGGMNAMKIMFDLLPNDFSIPIIIVQHIGSHSENLWIQLLNEKSKLEIKEADEKEIIENGKVYVAPANYHLLIERNKTFSLSIDDRVNYARPSIDVLFESAVEAYKDKLIGVILTGSNNDGTAGLRQIREAGGLTIVQDPVTAESDFMPASAIASFMPDYILSLEKIIQLLIEIDKQI